MNGYIGVDCKGTNLLAQSAQTKEGLYAESMAAIESGKPIIALNCEYGEGVPMTPIPVMAIVEANVCILTAPILQIRVAPNDSVTIVPLITQAASTRKTK